MQMDVRWVTVVSFEMLMAWWDRVVKVGKGCRDETKDDGDDDKKEKKKEKRNGGNKFLLSIILQDHLYSKLLSVLRIIFEVPESWG